MEDIIQALTWILNSGGSIAIVSWIAERLPWFQAQTAQAKETIFLVASVAISLAAYLILTYVPADILAQISPFFTIVYGVFATVFLGKAAHLLDKKTPPATK